MAVYTDVSDEELEGLVATYDIGDVLSFKGIAEGVENTNYFLRTSESSFILTLYEKRVNEKELPFFLNLMEYLSDRGINCPQPVSNKSGEKLSHVAGRPATIVTFLEGLSIRKPQAKHCESLGKALAQLHLAGQGFDMHRENNLSVSGWAPLFEKAKDRANSVASGLRERTESDLLYLQANWPKDLPQGIIHADLFTDNVFFIGDDVSGLIDFYFACTDALVYDLAICLNAWCFESDGSFNLTKGQSMIAGYQSLRPLNKEEIDALPILCRGAALRFMLTRLVDWLNVPPGALVKPKDPLEYDRKLGFHRHVTDASEYGLVR
ncbi:homoserine kinase [Microvirga sp. W0021]|uniref:Homoserine kinase n=1 Tax=Hohaiivirga grylli TaxID=3133970 RepID=A0ABV0BLD2_9HYPH